MLLEHFWKKISAKLYNHSHFLERVRKISFEFEILSCPHAKFKT